MQGGRPMSMGPRQFGQWANRAAMAGGFALPNTAEQMQPYSDAPGNMGSPGGGGGMSGGFGAMRHGPRFGGKASPDASAINRHNAFTQMADQLHPKASGPLPNNAEPAQQNDGWDWASGTPAKKPIDSWDWASGTPAKKPIDSWDWATGTPGKPLKMARGGINRPGQSARVGDNPDGSPNDTEEVITALPTGGVIVHPNPATRSMKAKLPRFAFGTPVQDVGDAPGSTVDQKLMALSWMTPGMTPAQSQAQADGVTDYGGGNRMLSNPRAFGSATIRAPGAVSPDAGDQNGTIDFTASQKAGTIVYRPDVVPAGNMWSAAALPYDRPATRASIAQDGKDMQTGADYRRGLDTTAKVNARAEAMPTQPRRFALIPRSAPPTAEQINTKLTSWAPQPQDPFSLSPEQIAAAGTEYQGMMGTNTRAGRRNILAATLNQRSAQQDLAGERAMKQYESDLKAERFKPQIIDLGNGQQALNMGGRVHMLHQPIDKLSNKEIEALNQAGHKVHVNADGSHTIDYNPPATAQIINERPIVHEMPTEPDANGVVGKKLVQWDTANKRWMDAPMAPNAAAAPKPKPSSWLDSVFNFGK